MTSVCVQSPVAGFSSRWTKTGRKRKLLIDGFAAPQAEPLRVSEFQAHPGTHPHVVRAGNASVPQGQARGVLWRRKRSIRAKSSIERGVNTADHRREW